MKKFKKIFAAIAASALVAAMSFTSMAASIQINRGSAEGTNNTTYNYYQVLKASVSSDKSAVAYYVNDEDLAEAIDQLKDSDGKDIFTVTSSVDKTKYNVILNNEMTGKDKGEDIAAAFKSIVDDTELVKKIATGPINQNSEGIYKTPDLEDGYYLIVSSLGTKLAINTATGADVCEIDEKNTYPTIDKFVDVLDKHQANHNIGDDVPYIIKVTVPENVDTKLTITINDEMAEDFLKFNNDVTAVVDGTNAEFDAFKTEVESNSNNSKFAITLNDLTKAKGKTITFKYTAKLLQAAENNTYYDNKAKLSYSNYVTLEKTASVRTFAFDLKKVNEAKTELTGAKFELRTNETDSDSAIIFVADVTKENYVKADSTAAGSKTIEAGNVNIRGIKDGTYYLVETEAPQGYNVLDHAITIVIDANGNVADHAGNVVEVENKKGIKLPSTGGMGTTVFAIVGLLVMAGAAVTLIVKKRA